MIKIEGVWGFSQAGDSHTALNNTCLLASFSFKRCSSLSWLWWWSPGQWGCVLWGCWMLTCISHSFFDPPTPQADYFVILFLTLWRITFQRELGGYVPSGRLKGLTPVRFHGCYPDLRAWTQNRAIQAVIEGGGTGCMHLHWKWLKSSGQRNVVSCLLWWDLRAFTFLSSLGNRSSFLLHISPGLPPLILSTSFHFYSLGLLLWVSRSFSSDRPLVMCNPG